MTEVPYPSFYPFRPPDYPVYTNPPTPTFSYIMSPPQSDRTAEMLVALERIEARLITIESFLRGFVDDGK